MFQPLTGLYEPSSIQQLADGRFLVVEDEKNHPFSLVTISAAGDVSSTPLLPPAGSDAAWKLDDLEALALDPGVPSPSGVLVSSSCRSPDGLPPSGSLDV